MQYQDISIVPDVALPYSGHTDHDKSVEGVSLRTNMNNSTSEPVSSSTTLQEMGSKARESKVTNTDALSNEAIAQYNTSHSLVGMLISLLKKHSTLSLRELSEYVGRRMDEIIKIKGKHYKGSLERIVGGALNASSAFVSTGHGMWTLNLETALEEEEAIYERFLRREKRRKRKRRKPLRMTRPEESSVSPEQMQLCLERTLLEVRRQQDLASRSMSLSTNPIQSNESRTTTTSDPDHILSTTDLYSLLQQDPFVGITPQDDFHDIMQKLGDENFCFVMQFFNYFREHLTHPAEVAARALPRIDVALQEIRNETKTNTNTNPIQPIGLDELNEVPAFDISKRRRTASQDGDMLFSDNGFNLNLNMNSENINGYASITPITWQSVINKETPIQPSSSIHPFYPVSIFNPSSQTLQSTVVNSIPHSIETNTNNSDLYETDTPTETDLKHSTDSTHPPS
ncbi:hypothetical protein WA171_000128, partial [Blastocystis sp. BT1]